MSGFNLQVTTRAKRVFLSYSHDDKEWLERFKVHVAPLTRSGAVHLWDDTSIPGGSRWNEEIEHALETSEAAILLVSANFLASKYVNEKELPDLADAASRRGLRLMWVLLSDCLFRKSMLSEFQCLNDPANPLDILNGKGAQEWELASIARKIHKELNL